jgi:uncharacterized protein (TIGR03000 family)
MSPKKISPWGLPALAVAAFLLNAGSGRAAGPIIGGGAHFASGAPGAFRGPLAPRTYHPTYNSNNYGRPNLGTLAPNYSPYRTSPFGYYPLDDLRSRPVPFYRRWDSGYFPWLWLEETWADKDVPPAANQSGPSSPPSGRWDPLRVQKSGEPAKVRVRLPAKARLWFNGTKMTSRGRFRTFETPDLKPGRKYSYQVRARWKRHGRYVTQTRKVVVTSGTAVRVHFPLAARARD